MVKGSWMLRWSEQWRAIAARGWLPPLLVVVLVVAASGCASGSPGKSASAAPSSSLFSGVQIVDPEQFAATVAANDSFLLNVHTPDEGSIPGTDATIPFDLLENRSDELPQSRRSALAVYCRSGRMSEIAVGTLAELGYRNVMELEGGMDAWQASGRVLLPPEP